MNLLPEEKRHADKLAAFFEKRSRQWKWQRVVTFPMLAAAIALVFYAHVSIQKMETSCLSLSAGEPHVPVDFQEMSIFTDMKVKLLEIKLMMYLNPLILLCVAAFHFGQAIADWNKDKTLGLLAKWIRHESEET